MAPSSRPGPAPAPFRHPPAAEAPAAGAEGRFERLMGPPQGMPPGAMDPELAAALEASLADHGAMGGMRGGPPAAAHDLDAGRIHAADAGRGGDADFLGAGGFGDGAAGGGDGGE